MASSAMAGILHADHPKFQTVLLTEISEGGAWLEKSMSHNCEYVRQHCQVPAEIGRRVTAYGKPGVILADRGHYIGVVLDEDPKKRISNYHPTHEMQYGEMAETLPLKEWLFLPFKHDWDDLDWNREAREDLVRVWAATRGQASTRPTSGFRITATASGRCCISKSGEHDLISESVRQIDCGGLEILPSLTRPSAQVQMSVDYQTHPPKPE